jgi:protein phosphatase PTC7
MFNFGSTEQVQSSKEVTNGTTIDEARTSDSGNIRAVVNGSHNDTAAEEFVARPEVSSDFDDVPDAETLSDLARGAEALAQELNVKEDEQRGEELRREEAQPQSEPSDKSNGTQTAGESMASSTTATPTDSSGSDTSGIGIQEQKPSDDVMFNSAAAMIPHPNKVKTGGEDAYFIDGTRWVGVADGVGGWALSGVNAGHYARELMWNCAERARNVGKTSDPKSVLMYAAKRTKSQGTAATLIASLYDQTLRVANIGDSGFVVVRDSSVVAKSIPMVRGFNFPYQIGTEGDDPALAEEYDIQVHKNDVVILGSDGIWDNLFERQIIEIVDSVQKAGGGPEVVAKELVRRANEMGLTKQGMSPFAKEAQRAGYDSYSGGKLDDATAVVSFVT